MYQNEEEVVAQELLSRYLQGIGDNTSADSGSTQTTLSDVGGSVGQAGGHSRKSRGNGGDDKIYNIEVADGGTVQIGKGMRKVNGKNGHHNGNHNGHHNGSHNGMH